jgi:hypothetical protein
MARLWIERNCQMTRNLRVLGLAFVAVLGMSAVASPAASADYLTSESWPVTLTGKQTGGGDVFTTTAGTVKCKEINYTASNVVPPTTTVIATPSIPERTAGNEQNCSGFGFPATVATNGCAYRLTIGAGTAGSLVIQCPEGQEITVTARSGAVTKCIVHIPPQTILAGPFFGNSGSGTTREVHMNVSINTMSYKHTAGTGVGSCTSGGGTGSYSGASIMTAENPLGSAHVGVFLS